MNSSNTMNNESIIKEFFDVTTQAAKEMFLARGKLDLAFFSMLERSGRITQLPVPLDNKDFASFILRNIIDIAKPLAVSFVTEVWLAERELKNGETVSSVLRNTGQVSELPDRKEGLLFVQETEHTCIGKCIPIIRGEKVSFGEEIHHADEIQGRFANLLKKSNG